MSMVEKAGLDVAAEGEAQHCPAVAEVATGVAVGPGRFEQAVPAGRSRRGSACRPASSVGSSNCCSEIVELGGHADRPLRARVAGDCGRRGGDDRRRGPAGRRTSSSVRVASQPSRMAWASMSACSRHCRLLRMRGDAVGLRPRLRRACASDRAGRTGAAMACGCCGVEQGLQAGPLLVGQRVRGKAWASTHCRTPLPPPSVPLRAAIWRRGVLVRPQLHEADFAQRRPAGDVQRAGELPAVDHDGLALRARTRTPRRWRRWTPARESRLSLRATTSRALAESREICPATTSWWFITAQRVGLADKSTSAGVAEADRPLLPADVQACQVDDDRDSASRPICIGPPV